MVLRLASDKAFLPQGLGFLFGQMGDWPGISQPASYGRHVPRTRSVIQSRTCTLVPQGTTQCHQR